MKPATTIALIALAGLAVVAALWATNSGSKTASPTAPTADGTSTSPGGGRRFLPSLESKINSVGEIVVKRAAFEFTVHKVGDTWRLKDRGDYPVKPEVVREVVIGLAELREMEPKTSRPEMYSKIGVDDPVAPPPDSKDQAVPQSTLLTLKDPSGAVLAELIVGNRKPGASEESSSVFVRRKGEAQSWQCQGNLDVPQDQLAWLDTQFANIDRARVRSVRVTPTGSADGSIEVSRATSKDPFKLMNMPEGKELKEPGSPESIAGALTYATFLDVAAASTVDFVATDASARTFELRTFDGLIVNASSIVKDAKTWWKLAASADEAVARTFASQPPDASKPDENKPTQEQIDGAVTKVKNEVTTLNAKWSGYAFAPQEFKAKPLNTSLQEMVKDPASATTPEKPEGAAARPVPPMRPPGMSLPAAPGSVSPEKK